MNGYYIPPSAHCTFYSQNCYTTLNSSNISITLHMSSHSYYCSDHFPANIFYIILPVMRYNFVLVSLINFHVSFYK